MTREVVTILFSDTRIGTTPAAFLRNLAGSLGDIEPEVLDSQLPGFETLRLHNGQRSKRIDYVFVKRDHDGKIWRGIYRAREKAMHDLFECMEIFCNSKRRHVRNRTLLPGNVDCQ